MSLSIMRIKWCRNWKAWICLRLPTVTRATTTVATLLLVTVRHMFLNLPCLLRTESFLLMLVSSGSPSVATAPAVRASSMAVIAARPMAWTPARTPLVLMVHLNLKFLQSLLHAQLLHPPLHLLLLLQLCQPQRVLRLLQQLLLLSLPAPTKPPSLHLSHVTVLQTICASSRDLQEDAASALAVASSTWAPLSPSPPPTPLPLPPSTSRAMHKGPLDALTLLVVVANTGKPVVLDITKSILTEVQRVIEVSWWDCSMIEIGEDEMAWDGFIACVWLDRMGF